MDSTIEIPFETFNALTKKIEELEKKNVTLSLQLKVLANNALKRFSQLSDTIENLERNCQEKDATIRTLALMEVNPGID
jgi:hypothetical protein